MNNRTGIGKIKSFDPTKGYGYIVVEGTQESLRRQLSKVDTSESIFFSAEDVVKTRSAPPTLREGQWVQFVVQQTNVGEKATQITLVDPSDNLYK